MPKLVLFDIDGTILNFRSSPSRELFSDLIKEVFGRDIPAGAMPSFAGMTDLQILKEICLIIDEPLDKLKANIDEIWETMYDRFCGYCTTENIELLPGYPALLEKILESDDLQLGLLTGNFQKNAYLKLACYDLDKYFPFGAFGSDHEDRNKLPDIAVARANEYAGDKIYSLEDILIIGDSPKDIECAHSNNLQCICVSTGLFSANVLRNSRGEIIFENFEDVDSVMISINKILTK